MKKIALAAGIAALSVTASFTAAHAANHHVSPGCKIVSQTRTRPLYSSLNDRTGIVLVTTVEKCRGQLVTTQTHETVTR